MQTLERAVCHVQTSDLHPVMVEACYLTSAAAAQCRATNLKQRNLLEPSNSNRLTRRRFPAGLDGRRG
jgi:hypothetical protein